MHIELKEYQEKAVFKLRDSINDLLETPSNEILVFKAPTGSGKTLMMAETLRRVRDSRIDNRKLSFVWIAVNKLHDQSHTSLKKYYDNEAVGIKCSFFEELENREIKENEILFFNWASINKKDNLFIRANERDNNLETVIQRTKEAGRIVILIIDESHNTASSDKSREVIDIIGPKVTIEVSATPQISSDNIVPVRIDDVRSEGMIKKEVVVNEDFMSLTVDKQKGDQSADEFVLGRALEKRLELAKLYENEESNVNPLLLIQLPNSDKGIPDKKEEILELLKKFGYVDNDDRIAVYLTGKEKINLDNIEKPQNEVEIMLFKQAIALGWDCPRATILVLFRQWTDNNITFSIQTLGRIMRMPEQKHYTNDVLNRAYLYTSLPDIEARIEQGDMKSDIKPYKSTRINSYENIDLASYHTKRHREETRLSSQFVPIFIRCAQSSSLDKQVSFEYSIPLTNLIADGHIINADAAGHVIKGASSISIKKNEVELQRAFDMFVRDNLEPYYPEQRSIKRINESIYAYFGARRDEDRWADIQAMVLADENKHYVINVISKAKEIYLETIGRGKNVIIANDAPWNVPESIAYDINHRQKDYAKSIIQPYYASTSAGKAQHRLNEEDSKGEVDFIESLEKSKKVNWWFKNGVGDETYFAVPYLEHGQEKAFYVDFVIQFNDGSLGLFDTKDGITAETAGPRAEGLAKYISGQNHTGKKLFGGIVVKSGNSWKYNDMTEYSYNPNNLTDWKFLEL